MDLLLKLDLQNARLDSSYPTNAMHSWGATCSMLTWCPLHGCCGGSSRLFFVGDGCTRALRAMRAGSRALVPFLSE